MSALYERLLRRFQTASPFVRRLFFHIPVDVVPLTPDAPTRAGMPHIGAALFLGSLRVGPVVHLCRHEALNK